MSVPKFDEMYVGLVTALKNLGGSGTNEEIEDETAKVLGLSDEDVAAIHKGNRTQFSYRLAWTKNYLKNYGLLENSSRGVWSLTDDSVDPKSLNAKAVSKQVKSSSSVKETLEFKEEELDAEVEWKQELLQRLRKVHPDGFEKICQKLLREAGFIDVKVTGKSGDGGIDGDGVIRINLISFKVAFQAKRYDEGSTVTSAQIREFRGAIAGKAEKGLYITTSRFTKDARQEALRGGVATIDLIDGERLADLMKELRVGVKIEMEEKALVDEAWISQFNQKTK
ncbi:restriction endonuclease [Candidatus Saccharibacteria bacterium]|nr:restriction endonuclease [Candidatus Saccharibacteria bacterium]